MAKKKKPRMVREEATRYRMYVSSRLKIMRDRAMAVMIVPMPSCGQHFSRQPVPLCCDRLAYTQVSTR